MTINDKFNQWQSTDQIKDGSKQQYRGKIRKFVLLHDNESVNIALSEDSIIEYVLNEEEGKGDPLSKYNAILNFFEFIYGEEKIFPVKRVDAEELNKKRKELGNGFNSGRNEKDGVVYLPDDFELKEFVEDKYFNHLSNMEASITLKAIFALTLSCGFQAKDYYNKSSESLIKLSNIIECNPTQTVLLYKNHAKDRNENTIYINGDLCRHIYDYYKLRLESKTPDDTFIIKLWNGRQLNYNDKYANRKPNDLAELVSYMLKYLSDEFSVEPMDLNHLVTNMIYHYLLNTRGSALNEIIRFYGHNKRIVNDAFDYYIEKQNITDFYGFDFFKKASSNKINDTTGEAQTRVSILERRIRDSEIVKNLKAKYDNKCQVCGSAIHIKGDKFYSEGHHIQPLGGEHCGDDAQHNLIILCPNHHVMFDLGILAIDPFNCKTVYHINENNKLHNTDLVIKHKISSVCIRYHYDNIFIPLKQEFDSMQ